MAAVGCGSGSAAEALGPTAGRPSQRASSTETASRMWRLGCIDILSATVEATPVERSRSMRLGSFCSTCPGRATDQPQSTGSLQGLQAVECADLVMRTRIPERPTGTG
jgi:hypothetical protein